MTRFIKTQNSFSNGAVSPEFYAHDNVPGLSKLENMDVIASGAITRRPGLQSVSELYGAARLVSFTSDAGKHYILALSDMHLNMYCDGVKVGDMAAPWPADALAKLQYAQRFGTMIFTHPDYKPQVLSRRGNVFEISSFQFAVDGSDMSIHLPFIRFDDSENIKITVTTNSSGNNYATFTTNLDFWTPECVGDTLKLGGKQWLVDAYISPTQIRAYTNGTYTLPAAPVVDWCEAAFGNRRGWPASITFHQDRLVFGGSRGYPGGLWMSQVGRHNNFDTGTGLDDEAIFVTLLSGQRQHIATVISGDNLQILTSVAEWAIASRPLTPSNVDIKQHTTVGSVATHHIPPQRMDGKTIFISSTQTDIRELVLDALGETYSATDLCALSKHLMRHPIDMAYNDARRQLFVVMRDGTMAVLNHNSILNISAWGKYTTMGEFKSVAACDGDTYVVVQRGDKYYLEMFNSDSLTDGDGYKFSYRVSGMPMQAGGHNVNKLRIHKINVRIQNTKSLLSVNNHRITLPDVIYDNTSPGFCGDVGVNILGTQHNCNAAPWTIHGNDSLPVTILSVTMYGNYIV